MFFNKIYLNWYYGLVIYVSWHSPTQSSDQYRDSVSDHVFVVKDGGAADARQCFLFKTSDARHVRPRVHYGVTHRMTGVIHFQIPNPEISGFFFSGKNTATQTRDNWRADDFV